MAVNSYLADTVEINEIGSIGSKYPCNSYALYKEKK